MAQEIIRTEYSEIMQKSFIDYSMSVILARAVPDVRDGLKPVQRRTLYDMYELKVDYNKPYKKSARIVGDTMGKYHPHGDSSIYEALVVMSQDFKKSLPLVDGHGNFGSIEGDGAAAMRYTEARLAKVTQEVYLGDLDKNVVDFVPNYDETEKEPAVLPVRVPNLLINGSDGIAVGMVTSIPQHNLSEVIDGVIAYMKNPDINTTQMLEYIKGPDFPTGGIVTNKDELLSIYSTGLGKIKIRGKAQIEQIKGGKEQIVITEIPYPMIGANIGKFLNDIFALVESKKTNDIVDISNQSNKDGMRIIVELKKGADAQNVLNLLYKKTRLEDTFGVNMLAERTAVRERILTEIKGRMLEDIVLLETKLANPGKEVFVLQFPVGEFDMVVFNPENASCQIYEIKHSKEAVPQQYRHLIDEEKCAQTEHRYGEITGKFVLYRGKTKMTDNKIMYWNVEEYLRNFRT